MGLWTVLAMAWVLLYGAWFFSFELPNSTPPVRRVEVLRETPALLLNLVDRLPPAADDPDRAAALVRWEHYGWRYAPQRFGFVLVSALVLAGAASLGHLLLRIIRVPLPARCLERTVLACGSGLSGVSLATLGCGLAGRLSRDLLGGGLLVLVLMELVVRVVERWRRRPAATGRQARAPWWPLLVAVPFLFCMLFGAILPETDFDVKEYHFEGPKEWYQAGRISFLPHNVYTSMPFLTEMLTLLGMVLVGDWYWGALAGKGVLMCFAPLTALGLFAAGRRWFSTSAGVLAALIHLSTPWIYRISVIGYAEGGLTFYLFAALLAAGLALERLCSTGAGGMVRAQSRASGSSPPVSENVAGELDAGVLEPASIVQAAAGDALTLAPGPLVEDATDSRPEGSLATARVVEATEDAPPVASSRQESQAKGALSLRFVFVAGLLAGSALACKYPGVVSVELPIAAALCAAPFVVRRPPRHPGRTAVVCGIVFVVGSALTAGPWLAKNAVETGNPVYPLLYSVFGGRDWDAASNAKWWNGHRPGAYTLTELRDKFVDVTAKADWLNPLLFAFAPLAWLARGSRRATLLLWLYVAYLFGTWWLLTHRLDRFWVPLIPVASLLAGAGAAWSRGRVWRVFAWGIFGFAAIFNLAFISTPLCGNNDFLVDLPFARGSSIRRFSPAIAMLNRLPPRPHVLCVGEAAVFDADFPVVYNTVFDRSIFEEWCAAPEEGVAPSEWKLRDAAAIREAFAAAGITHVFVNWMEILRYREPGSYGYTAFVSPQRFGALQELGILGPPLPVSAEQSVDDLSPGKRAELESWGAALIVDDPTRPAPPAGKVASEESTSGDEKAAGRWFPGFQIFPVLPPAR